MLLFVWIDACLDLFGRGSKQSWIGMGRTYSSWWETQKRMQYTCTICRCASYVLVTFSIPPVSETARDIAILVLYIYIWFKNIELLLKKLQVKAKATFCKCMHFSKFLIVWKNTAELWPTRNSRKCWIAHWGSLSQPQVLDCTLG